MARPENGRPRRRIVRRECAAPAHIYSAPASGLRQGPEGVTAEDGGAKTTNVGLQVDDLTLQSAPVRLVLKCIDRFLLERSVFLSEGINLPPQLLVLRVEVFAFAHK